MDKFDVIWLYSKGKENCLEGLTFVITEVLESIERDDAAALIQRYGGKVTQAVSKKTSYIYIVVGQDPGESKRSQVRAVKGSFTLYCTHTVHSQIVLFQKSMYTDTKTKTKQFLIIKYHPIETNCMW